jgi:Leucine-rich repeat (LRR) protein
VINRNDELNNKKFHVYNPDERNWKYTELNEQYLTDKLKPYDTHHKIKSVYNTENYELDLSHHDILTDDVLEYIVPFLKKNPNIIKLDVSGGRIQAPGAIALAEITTLISLNLSKNRITRGGIDGVKALASNRTLTYLNLSRNKITSTLAEILAKNTTLISLNLSRNSIGDQGAIALANHPTLTFLDLSYNDIYNKGAIALANNSTLTSLNLRFNYIYSKGTIALAENQVLTSLDLSANLICSGESASTVEKLAFNTTLKSLNLSETAIGDFAAEKLSKNTTLTSLDLSHNIRIGHYGAIALANNPTLTSLNLSYNPIGDKGAIALAKTKTLKLLSVCGLPYSPTGIGPDGAVALITNPTLVCKMDGNNISNENGMLVVAGLATAYGYAVETKRVSNDMDRMMKRNPMTNPDHKTRPIVRKITVPPETVARHTVGYKSAVLAQGARQKNSFFGLPVPTDITVMIAARLTNVLSLQEAEKRAQQYTEKPKC